MRAIHILGLVLLLSGCLGAGSPSGVEPADGCPGPTSFWVPGTEGVETDGVRRSDILGFFPNASHAAVPEISVPEGWRYDVESIGAPDGNGSLVRLGLLAPSSVVGSSPGAPPKIRSNWSVPAAAGCPAGSSLRAWSYAPVEADRVVRPGDGVSVYYAGFWLNGTLFSTNMRSVDESGWPRGGWYVSEAGAPLNVYVYEKDRSERAPVWGPTNPATNQPVDWSYYPTIVGFNEALKGLSVGSSRVVVIPPEKAYTQPGRESHILYGDALVFFIDVVEVVDVPCPPLVLERSACAVPS